MRVHGQKRNREKYSTKAREEREAAAICLWPPSCWSLSRQGPSRVAWETTSAPQALSPRGGTRTAAGTRALWRPPELWVSPPPPTTEEKLWRVWGSLWCKLQQVRGVVGGGVATNAPSATPQASHLATCFLFPAWVASYWGKGTGIKVRPARFKSSFLFFLASVPLGTESEVLCPSNRCNIPRKD